MPNIEALIKTIVEPLIEFPQDFSIEQIETEDFMEYHLHLNAEDVGRVIGKKGRVVRAIRTIVYGIRHQGTKRPRIVVVDGDNE